MEARPRPLTGEVPIVVAGARFDLAVETLRACAGEPVRYPEYAARAEAWFVRALAVHFVSSLGVTWSAEGALYLALRWAIRARRG